jgi:hypothetical protein
VKEDRWNTQWIKKSRWIYQSLTLHSMPAFYGYQKLVLAIEHVSSKLTFSWNIKFWEGDVIGYRCTNSNGGAAASRAPDVQPDPVFEVECMTWRDQSSGFP